MTSAPAGFGIAAQTESLEAEAVQRLHLTPLPLPPDLARATGVWKDAPVTLETRAYHGPAIRYARCALVRSADLEIGNLLALPDTNYPFPILGADFVAFGRDRAMFAIDLSPVLPPGAARDSQLAGLRRRREAHPPFPPGGDLPAWCAAWFSPHALYTRPRLDDLPAVRAAVFDFLSAFADLLRAALPDPESASAIRAAQAGYAAAHREDDKGLRLLAKMFGEDWAARYLAHVLFPAPDRP